ncbi:hypothetical protein, partial [Enterobacter hormaechei]
MATIIGQTPKIKQTGVIINAGQRREAPNPAGTTKPNTNNLRGGAKTTKINYLFWATGKIINT